MGMIQANFLKLTPTFRQSMIDAIIVRAPQMIPQGLTNALYGLSLMGAEYAGFPKAFHVVIYTAIVRCFTSVEYLKPENSQSVSNTLYSLAGLGYRWSELPVSVRSALLRGFAEYRTHFNTQEFSVAVHS